MADVIVIGGGPAGSSAAIRLAQTGRKVRLYEKTRFPRPKLCGGFLGAEALSNLEELGLLTSLRAQSYPLHRMVVASRRGSLLEAPLPSEALSISRELMDDLLLQRARDLGVNIRLEEAGVRETNTGQFTVIATGRQVTPLSHPSPSALSPWYSSPTVTYFGLQASFEGVQGITDQVELDLIESGYVGLARLPDGTVNVCTLTTQEALERLGPSLDNVLAAFVKENPVLRGHLAGATRKGEWMAVGPVRLGIRTLAKDSTFYIGDAACVVDPFAGEGMAMGMYASKLLVQALNQQDSPPAFAYTRLWRQAFMPALRWNAVIRSLYSLSVLREPAFHFLKGFPQGLPWLTGLTRYREMGDTLLQGVRKFKTAAVCLLVLLGALRAGAAPLDENLRVLRINPDRSEISFSVSNFGVHKVKGRFLKGQGGITYTPQDPTKSLVHMVLQAASIDTGNAERDKHLKTSDFFDVAKFGTLIFHSQSVTKTGDHYTLTGLLTLKGTQHPVTISFVFHASRSSHAKIHLQAEGDTSLDRRDFGITYGNAFMVGNKVRIHLSIEADETTL